MPMDRERPRIDRDLRELLTYLRDTFRDAASRIDDYLIRNEPAPRGRDTRDARDNRGDNRGDRNANWGPRDAARDEWRRNDRPHDNARGNDRGDHGAHNASWGDHDDAPRGEGSNSAIHEPLERLREEVRTISNDAPQMDPSLLRLHIEAITAETRQLQGRANDPTDQEIAARIMRALTAIVSEHRPGHVYGLARHHQTDWDEMARRARDEIRTRGTEGAREPSPGNE